MKTRNKHGRVGVKTPLSHTQRRQAFRQGYQAGQERTRVEMQDRVLQAKSLRELKKELGL